jgi:hypothetical protein
MHIYLYPLNSLDDLPAALHQGCRPVTLFDANPQHGWQAVQTQINGSDAVRVVQYAQDYFSLTNYALLYEINEAESCESTSREHTDIHDG